MSTERIEELESEMNKNLPSTKDLDKIIRKLGEMSNLLFDIGQQARNLPSIEDLKEIEGKLIAISNMQA